MFGDNISLSRFVTFWQHFSQEKCDSLAGIDPFWKKLKERSKVNYPLSVS